MRWLLLPAVAFLLLFAGHAEARAQVTIPIRIAVIIPKDYPAYMDFDAACARAEEWVQEIQAWWIQEVNLTFDYEFTCLHASRTIYEMSAYIGGGGVFDGCATAPIPEGWFATDINHMGGLLYAETGWVWGDDQRDWFIGIGFGGDASGYHAGGSNDYGSLLLGDWALAGDVLGSPPACDSYGIQDSWPFGHEALHTMDVDSQNELGTGDVLSTQQRRDLKNHNRKFLRAP